MEYIKSLKIKNVEVFNERPELYRNADILANVKVALSTALDMMYKTIYTHTLNNKTIAQLIVKYKVSKKVAETYYNDIANAMSKLPQVALTLQDNVATAKNSLGTLWSNKWQFGSDGRINELNVAVNTADFKDFREILHIMWHELIHHINGTAGIQDVSRQGRAHNKHFALLSEYMGLYCEVENNSYVDKGVMENSIISKSIEDIYAKCGLNNLEIELKRLPKEQKNKKPKAKTNLQKYVCPCCNQIVRAKLGAKIICGDCYENTNEIVYLEAVENDKEGADAE